MKSAEIKNRAFAAFIAGKPLRQIAEDEGLARRTVEKWSVADNWMAERTMARVVARRLAIEQRIPALADEFTSIEAAKCKLTMKAIAQLTALVEGGESDLAENQLSMSRSELIRLVAQLTK